MDCLHEELTHGFKVVLAGEEFPGEFKDGDVLDIGNSLPDDSGYVLVKRNGKHEIHWYDENKPSLWSVNELIGTILAFQRSCSESELGLGDEPDNIRWLTACCGCQYAEAVECASKAKVYCLTSQGLEPAGVWGAGCRREPNRPGTMLA